MPHPPYGHEDTSFKTAGEEAGIRRLVNDFYDHMEALPEAKKILAMHPRNLVVSRDKLTLFLCGWLGAQSCFGRSMGSFGFRWPISTYLLGPRNGMLG